MLNHGEYLQKCYFDLSELKLNHRKKIAKKKSIRLNKIQHIWSHLLKFLQVYQQSESQVQHGNASTKIIISGVPYCKYLKVKYIWSHL